MSGLKNKIVLLLCFLVLCVIGFVIFSKYNISISFEDDKKVEPTPTLIGQSTPEPTITPTPVPLPTLTQEQLSSRHTPVKLNQNDILVSFRLDDITFVKSQKSVLEKALYLARKYNITFDLAVIAKTFDENADPEVFKIYEDNKDVFEIVAHGYNHLNYEYEDVQSEFGGVPAKVQEEHIKKMLDIFQKHKLTLATKIFFLPWSSGDENTINLSKKYGYKLMTQSITPDNTPISKNNGIIVVKTTSNVSGITIDNFNTLLAKNSNHIEIMTHPIESDFGDLNVLDNLIKTIIDSDTSHKIKFDFVSRLL